MLEFFENYYFIPLYGIALVISLIRYRSYYDTVLKYFPIIIAYTFLSEILGYIIGNFESFQIIYSEKRSFLNSFVYNIFDIVFFLYFYFVFWKAITNSTHREVIKYGTALFVISCLINLFFQNILILPQVYAITVGSLLLITFSIFYIRQTIAAKKSNCLILWTSIGLLIFYSFYPINMFLGVYSEAFYERFHLTQFHRLLIVAMYMCFIIGFWKMKRRPSMRISH
ncbi:hypothetical protein MNBD_BACTEROID03-1410 [hydrothermal vent metagenome]|uniref:Uncharacterized protein n=1 Tax=hydrothermal vent metagenome TaxID=652676 RepID=A0A3B0TN97_9ZZZZ